MSTVDHKNINPMSIKPSTPSKAGARLDRVTDEFKKNIASERGVDGPDLFFKSPEDPSAKKADDLKHVKELSQKNSQKNQLLVEQSNKNAAAILLRAALLADPGLSEFPKKGTEGKSQEEAQAIWNKNIDALTNGPDNIKTLHTIASTISDKLSGDKASKNSNESEETPENQALLADLQSVIDSGSHEQVQQFLERLKGTNPQLLSALKGPIKDYKESLKKVFDSEQRNIANLDEMKKNPLFQDGVSSKGDKALRNAQSVLAGIIIDQKGGIYNYSDTDVTWQLAPFEHKPGVDGRTVTDLSIRRLLPSELANNNTYTAHLTEEQPTYTTMQVA